MQQWEARKQLFGGLRQGWRNGAAALWPAAVMARSKDPKAKVKRRFCLCETARGQEPEWRGPSDEDVLGCIGRRG